MLSLERTVHWWRRARAFLFQTIESARLLYDLHHKPQVLLFWLQSAARKHGVFITFVVALVFGVSFALGSPQFGGFLWIAGLATIVACLLADLREAVGRAARKARSLTKEADAVCDRDPSRSLALYRIAAGLTSYPGDESMLRNRIRETESALAARSVGGGAAGSTGPPAAPPEGGQIGERYTRLGELGRGATGAVYRADDTVLDRSIALKELNLTVTDDDMRARFRREARILARLNHPNIVQIYDLVEHRSRLWIAMELVEGGSLAETLGRAGRMVAADAARLGERMAGALAFAHGRGVIHRDLKPANILLADERTPKITDFGLAKLSEGYAHTVEGTVLGSPRYMSPEQAEGGAATEQSDIYSLGVLLYHMLTGAPPFDGDVRSVLMQQLRRKPAPVRDVSPDVPPELACLVEEMLSKEPAGRPADMASVALRLHLSLQPTGSAAD